MSAFAGDESTTIITANGRHVWLATPKPKNAWDRFLVKSRDRTEAAFELSGNVMEPVAFVLASPAILASAVFFHGELP